MPLGAQSVTTGEKQRLIKTLPRKGFRFVGTVQEEQRPAAASASSAVHERRRRHEAPPSAPRLSIVVLPFANLSGDPEQDYFVDGVTESLTTDLSRISGSFVIGRNTAFTYKGKAVDLKQIGRELNVRYVLEGSVQRGGNRLRVNVQLDRRRNRQSPMGRAVRQAHRRPVRHAGRNRLKARQHAGCPAHRG